MPDTLPTTNGTYPKQPAADPPAAWTAKPALEPLLVDARKAAALLSVSVATFWRWQSSGELGPIGMKKGGRRLWALAELRAWVAEAMPRREIWIALQAQRNGRG